jgi:hypothetical protein
MDLIAIKYVYEHLPLKDPPKFSQIGIFSLKICHLATLIPERKSIGSRRQDRQAVEFPPPRSRNSTKAVRIA